MCIRDSHNVFDAKVELNKKEKAKIAALPEAEQAAATAEALEKAKKDVKKLTLAPVAARLNELLGGKVTFASDVIGDDAKKKVADCRDGECVLLENLRFHKGEEKKEPDFMKALASYCDVYVNDAFGTAHRSHASTAGIVEEGLVKTAVCGFLIEKELSVMADTLENPQRPFVAILGGAKVADKLNVISNLLEKCDTLVIGGGMAYTFIKAQGGEIGTSLVDEEKLGYCKEMLEKAAKLGKKLVLPVDTVAAKSFPEWASISAPKRESFSRMSWQTRNRLSGTAPWACSKIPCSPRAPKRWRRRSRTSMARPRRLSAAATARRPYSSWASRIK